MDPSHYFLLSPVVVSRMGARHAQKEGGQYEAMTKRQNDINLISSVNYTYFNIPVRTPKLSAPLR